MDFNSMGGFESGGEGIAGSAEAAKEASERFQEQARRSAAQAKRDQKQERQKKQQDTTLARVIMQFLQTPRFSGFFLVVSRALSRNIPSDFLLAILSLIHKDAFEELVKKEFPKIELSESFIEKFPPQFALPLQQWNIMIISVATAEPQRVLETILDDAWNIDVNTKQLIAMVLREYFLFQKFEVPFEAITQFAEIFLQSLVDRLEKQIQGQMTLPSPEEDFLSL